MSDYCRDDVTTAASAAQELESRVFDAKADRLAVDIERAIKRNEIILQENDVFDNGRKRRTVEKLLNMSRVINQNAR